MKNLNIASWNLKSRLFELKPEEEKIGRITDFMNDKDIDILALQNAGKLLCSKLDDRIRKMGYHFDHLEEECILLFNEMINKEKNPIIIRDNFLNKSEVINEAGLVINKVYITDENNLADKFCIVNTTISNTCDINNFNILADCIEYDKLELVRKCPIIVTGGLNINRFDPKMDNLERTTLNKNNIHTVAISGYKNNIDYLMLNDFEIEDSNVYDEYALGSYSKPIYAKVKMK